LQFYFFLKVLFNKEEKKEEERRKGRGEGREGKERRKRELLHHVSRFLVKCAFRSQK